MRIFVSGASKTVRELAPRYQAHLGALLTPFVGNSPKATHALGLPWAADNGCFTGFNPFAYLKMLSKISGEPGLEWVTAPDRVGDAATTLYLWGVWEPVLRQLNLPVAFVGQDGCKDIPPTADAFFIGGSTEWKLGHEAAMLAETARGRGMLVHMGRVNTVQRIEYALSIGCDSIDGSSCSRFPGTYLADFVSVIENYLAFGGYRP